MQKLNYAIIAAGDGSRLAAEGLQTPKPLIEIEGRPIVERLIRIFERNGAASVSIIVNEYMTEVQQFLYSLHTAVPLNIVVKTTPSSMHSFHALREFLRGGKFCLTTVDTIFREDEFTDYINTFLADNLHDGLMAVTSFIDDEKPLYVETDADRRITAFADRTLHPQYVSGGIYGLSDRSIAVLERCMQAGQERMRNFQRQLIADGLQLAAMPFSKIIDIDHIEDIEKAGKFLTAERV